MCDPDFARWSQLVRVESAVRDRRLQVALSAAGYGLTQTLAAAPSWSPAGKMPGSRPRTRGRVLTAALDAALYHFRTRCTVSESSQRENFLNNGRRLGMQAVRGRNPHTLPQAATGGPTRMMPPSRRRSSISRVLAARAFIAETCADDAAITRESGMRSSTRRLLASSCRRCRRLLVSAPVGEPEVIRDLSASLRTIPCGLTAPITNRKCAAS